MNGGFLAVVRILANKIFTPIYEKIFAATRNRTITWFLTAIISLGATFSGVFVLLYAANIFLRLLK